MLFRDLTVKIPSAIRHITILLLPVQRYDHVPSPPCAAPHRCSTSQPHVVCLSRDTPLCWMAHGGNRFFMKISTKPRFFFHSSFMPWPGSHLHSHTTAQRNEQKNDVSLVRPHFVIIRHGKHWNKMMREASTVKVSCLECFTDFYFFYEEPK